MASWSRARRCTRSATPCNGSWEVRSGTPIPGCCWPGAAHAVSVFWRAADWEFLCWYVDLQAPFARTTTGFESEDYVLDIVIPPDFAWYWKDEDEFAAAQRVGRFSAAQATAIRAEGESVVEAIEARGWPFDAGWERWRPDPAWMLPMLPDRWDS